MHLIIRTQGKMLRNPPDIRGCCLDRGSSSWWVSIAIIACVSLASLGCKKDAAPVTNGEITVVSYGGGAYQDSHRMVFCDPFAKLTNSSVHSVVWNTDYGKLKEMVDSGSVAWDVVEVTAAEFERGRKDNLFDKLDVVPNAKDFLPGTVSDHGVGNVYWGTVLAYKRKTFPSDPPRDWTAFWDVERYPGARGMYDDPRGNLEFALLADGVSAEKLYPLDVDRAFAKLTKIKPHIRVLWSDGTQPVQLLLTDTVVLSTAWNGRIFASPQARADLDFSWQGAALELDYWVIPRGSRNRNLASRFIYYASMPETLSRQAQMIGYGPVNRAAVDLVPETIRTQLPTYPDNWNKSFVVNAEWWKANEAMMKTRWSAWKNN